MSLSFFALFGVYRRPCVCLTVSSFDEQGMPWDFMGSNGNFWVLVGISCVIGGSGTGFCGGIGSKLATARDHAGVIR
jgi:hypothetical protein